MNLTGRERWIFIRGFIDGAEWAVARERDDYRSPSKAGYDRLAEPLTESGESIEHIVATRAPEKTP